MVVVVVVVVVADKIHQAFLSFLHEWTFNLRFQQVHLHKSSFVMKNAYSSL